MKELNKHKIGLVFGLICGGSHLIWSLLVALGLAQTILNWIYSLHFLNNPFTVAEFNIGTAVILVATAFVVSYIVGWFFAFVWNKMHK